MKQEHSDEEWTMVELTSDENCTFSPPPNPVSPTGLVYLPERPNSAEGKIGTGNSYTCTCYPGLRLYTGLVSLFTQVYE